MFSFKTEMIRIFLLKMQSFKDPENLFPQAASLSSEAGKWRKFQGIFTPEISGSGSESDLVDSCEVVCSHFQAAVNQV